MGSSENGNGNHDIKQSALEVVEHQLEDRKSNPPEDDPLYAWKAVPVGGQVTLEQIHAGLLSVSQIAEAAIEAGVKITHDVRPIFPALHEVSTQLQTLTAELTAIHELVKTARKDIQLLKDESREMADHVRLVPAIKRTLIDVLTRLPEA